MSRIAVVLGTYNRFPFLERAVGSLRENAGVDCDIIVVDGGSSDGSRDWLAAQEDVVLIGQRGPLTGAVRAFNHGFSYAVNEGYEYIFHFNDDAELITPCALAIAESILEDDPARGAVAFAHNLRGDYGFEDVHGVVYPNYGLIRRQAGMEAALAQTCERFGLTRTTSTVATVNADSSYTPWWNPIYRTYAADSEFACWLVKTGWKIYPAHELRVQDNHCQDELRATNEGDNPNRSDSEIFWKRWPTRESICGAG